MIRIPLPETGSVADQLAVQVNAFMRRVYNYWMALGLALSGLVAWWVGNTSALGYFIAPQTNAPTMLYWGSMIGVFILVMVLSAGIRRIQVGTATTLFLLYAGLNGVFLAPLLLMYTSARVFTCKRSGPARQWPPWAWPCCLSWMPRPWVWCGTGPTASPRRWTG